MINLSNRPTHTWPAEMIQAAIAEDRQTEIPWFPFPQVGPDWSNERILAVAAAVVADIVRYNDEVGRDQEFLWHRHHRVYVEGDPVMAAVLVAKLQQAGFECVALRDPRAPADGQGGFPGFRTWPRLKMEDWW